MKICPTCKSRVFDDMDTCFGCMYRFGSDPAREREAEALGWPPSPEEVEYRVPLGERPATGEAPRAADGALSWKAAPGSSAEREVRIAGILLRIRTETVSPGAATLSLSIEPTPQGAGAVEAPLAGEGA